MKRFFFSSVLLVWSLLLLPGGAVAQPDAPSDLQLEPLRTWMKQNWYDGLFDDLGYNGARMQMYGFVDASAGQIECIYTGFQQSSGFVTYPNPINAEHLVPQSFYGGVSPMKSDIWSIRPCHGSANSARSNDPYGEVSDGSAQWYGVDGSGNYLSTGSTPSNPDDFSESTGSIWEPREEVKGDVARCVFYFYTMYPTQAGDISGVCDPSILYTWHLEDPVSPVEVTRNNRTETAQGNRNPYIDHPDWVYRAWFWEPPAVVPGCMSATACNFHPAANEDDGSCVFEGDACDDGDAMTFDDLYTDCGLPGYGCEGTPVTVSGCTSGSACNFDPAATQNDGSCIFEGDPCDDGDPMTFNDFYTDCDAPGYGCQGQPATVFGCTSGSACNFNPAATENDGSCVFVGDPCDDGDPATLNDTYTDCNTCSGEIDEELCPVDFDGDGLVAVNDVLFLLGNFGCLSGCVADVNGDDQVTATDMLAILAEFGNTCP